MTECRAKQYSDRMTCDCGNEWDTNDPHPPACRVEHNAALNPDMPAQELRLHMGEVTAGEMRAARAAIQWANSVMQAENDRLNGLLSEVKEQAAIISDWLPKDGKFDVLEIDSDKVEAWVKRLEDLSSDAPDQTPLNKERAEYSALLNNHNYLIDQYNKLQEEIDRLRREIEAQAVLLGVNNGE